MTKCSISSTSFSFFFILVILHLAVAIVFNQSPLVRENQPSSEGTMEGVNLRRTRSFASNGITKYTGLLWKSAKLFELNNAATFAPSNVGPGIDLTGVGYSDPIYADGLIFFDVTLAARQNYVLALNSKDGSSAWTFSNSEPISSPTIVDDTVYVAALDGNFYALDSTTGSEKWRYRFKGSSWYVGSAPAVSNGIAFFSSLSGDLFALDLATRKEKWIFRSKGILTPVAISKGTVFFGSDKGVLYAVDELTGAEKWMFKTKGRPGTPIVNSESVIVRGDQGLIYSVNARSGIQEWQSKSGGDFSLIYYLPWVQKGVSLALSDGTVVFVNGSGKVANLIALDAKIGIQKWVYEIGRVGRSPVITNNIVYIGSEGSLHATELSSGKKLWALGTVTTVGGKAIPRIASSPYVHEGVLYFLVDDGHLYALR